jgi:16S rRNA (adenine1518-N6/adenine1519-N6)-dimethyltransferase
VGRRLGQHFLNDPAILDRIVDAIDPQSNDVVLEIGAGKGTLTRRVAPRVGRVVAIERDRELVDWALGAGRWALEFPTVRVVHGDALELHWPELLDPRPAPSALRPASSVQRPAPSAHYKVIGNIPYYITSPLIEKALTPPAPVVIVFLVQQEVADRLAAEPGSKTYGALSVGVQVAARVERLFTVRAGSFDPPPDVHSVVVRLTPRKHSLIPWEDHAAFRRFVTAVFGQRRKQLGRALRSVTGGEKNAVEARLEELGVEPTARAEVLSPQRLVELFLALGR